MSVWLFQGGLSGEVESGQRLSDKRRLQERHGHTHPGETNRERGSLGNGGCVRVRVGGGHPVC